MHIICGDTENEVTKFTAVFRTLDILKVYLGCRGNNVRRFARVRKRRYFSKRQACMFSQKYGPRKSSYGFWGSAISSPMGPRAEPLAEIKHLKHCHNIGEPRFLQWREFTGNRLGIF